jgi:hypothetical protein
MTRDEAMGFLLGYLAGDGNMSQQDDGTARWNYPKISSQRADRLIEAGTLLSGSVKTSVNGDDPSKTNVNVTNLPTLGWRWKDHDQNYSVPNVLWNNGPGTVGQDAIDGFIVGVTECEGSTEGKMLDTPSPTWASSYAAWLVSVGYTTAHVRIANDGFSSVWIDSTDWPKLEGLHWLTTSRVPGMG